MPDNAVKSIVSSESLPMIQNTATLNLVPKKEEVKIITTYTEGICAY